MSPETTGAGVDMLGPRETAYARRRLVELASEFSESGVLRSPEWRGVFERTWRHPFVPRFYIPNEDAEWRVVDGANADQREEWLAGVYSDQTLITQLTPTTMSDGDAAPFLMYTSSSTLPSLMLRMLDALDVRDGQRVLEIGTGSGYNAALLSARIGSITVTTIDVDSKLADQARGALAATGHTPTVIAGDGMRGYPANAPYDRIIATCSVTAVPAAWVEQVRPGGSLLVNLHTELTGVLAALTVTGPGTATGRFLPGIAGFMSARPGPDSPPAYRRPYSSDDRTVDSHSPVDPDAFDDPAFAFVADLHLPAVHLSRITATDGDHGLRLTAEDGSWAEAWHTRTDGGHPVRQAGPRRLWRAVERAHDFFEDHDRPSWERFCITVRGSDQRIWFGEPDSQVSFVLGG